MQKYKSNITTTSGAAVRGVPVLVIDEDGNNAALFLDRAGTVPALNPLTTGPDGVFYFYAVNGRYSLRTTVDGVTITDDDVVLMMDPEEITVAGPIAEAVAAAQAAATAAEFAVEASGIPDLVAVTQATSAANNAAISKTGADSARDDAVIAKNAAEAALDSFDDRYLGAKAVAPTTDNDGGALLPGALYWDTVIGAMRAWSGSVWVTLPAATKASVGLGNVDNTSDAAKPVSAATQTALDAKQNSLGFTPIQQGGGNGQSTNKVYVGWAADASGLMAQVDATNFGNSWPINISKNAATATNLATARAINGVSFDGSANISINAAAVPNTPAGSVAATTVQAAINELDAEKFGRNTILGTVSQSAGVPTGAVIERGSNANGEYVRFADGTQICTGAVPTTALAASTTTNVPVTYPAAFVGVYTLSGYGTPDTSADFYGVAWCSNTAPTVGAFVYRNGSTAQNIISGRYMAVGRWF